VPGPTLTEWLREQNDQTLADLLRARPDVATPPPADSAVLAARAAARVSVARAVEGLDTFTLAVLDALVVAEADREPAALTLLTGGLGDSPAANRVAAAVGALRRLALAWGPDEAIAIAPAVREASGPYPAGLGRPSDALAGIDIPALLADLSEAERRLLTTLAHGSPLGRTRDAAADVPLERAETPVQRLLARGLLVRRDAETVELPMQVGLAIRGGTALGIPTLEEPDLRTSSHRTSTVDSTAAGAVLELVRHVAALITLWSAEPPPALKSGGLGVRELRRLARELDIDERRASLLAEVATGAALITSTATGTTTTGGQWVPTTLADGWLAASPAAQWVTLASAWLELPRLPGLAGMRDANERLLAPLSEDLRRPPAPTERLRVLDTLAQLPPGTGVATPESLVAVLAWRAPRRGGRLRDEIVRWTLGEATALGLIALGAVTTPGRTLLEEGPATAAKRMAEALPDPVDHVLVQADLTIIAPGRLEPELAEAMAEVADVESAGSATVYRVGERSIRRALDSGRTAAELHDLFGTRSRTPVPQSLTYLIDDVARRHGRLRGGTASAFLRSDDPTLLTEVLAHPAAGTLDLRRIAPTVLVSPYPLAEVLDELRNAGFAPAAEGPEGQLLDLRPRGRRVPAPARQARRPALPRPRSDDHLAELVRTVRAGDRTAGRRHGKAVSPQSGAGVTDTAATVALLREAIERNSQVWIWFVDSHGSASQRIVDPFRVGGGVLEGLDVTHGVVARYPLHRITSAALVED
jgi:hypothetical protein